MAIATTPLAERIARVLAAFELSDNADGSLGSAGPEVDHEWQGYSDRANAVLKAMREADEEMAVAGDPAVWTRMIAAALGDQTSDQDEKYEAPEPGTDPLHEGP